MDAPGRIVVWKTLMFLRLGALWIYFRRYFDGYELEKEDCRSHGH